MSIPPVFATHLSQSDYQQMRLTAGPSITQNQPQQKKFPAVPVALGTAAAAVVLAGALLSPQIKKSLPDATKVFIKSHKFLKKPIEWANDLAGRVGKAQDKVVKTFNDIKNKILKK